MSRRGAINAGLREKNKPEILDFIDDLKLEYRWIAGDWHLRIENKFDVFPTTRRWFNIVTKYRGDFRDYEDLGRVFFEQMKLIEDIKWNPTP